MELDSELNSSLQITMERKAQLREMLNKIEVIENKDDTSIQTVSDINEILQELNALELKCSISSRIENADETLLDVMVLNTASNLVLKCVDAVDLSASVYECTEFASKILESVIEPNNDQGNGLLKLLKYANDIIDDVPQYSFLFGASENKVPEPKIQKDRVKKINHGPVVKKQLLKVDNLDSDEQGIDVTITFLTTVLQEEFEKNENSPINYFEYVIDTSDFSKTVENIFYTSFLLRDGRARISINDFGIPTIEPMRKRMLKSFRNDKGQNNQMIPSITMEQWKNIKIKEGFLQRNSAATS